MIIVIPQGNSGLQKWKGDELVVNFIGKEKKTWKQLNKLPGNSLKVQQCWQMRTFYLQIQMLVSVWSSFLKDIQPWLAELKSQYP